MNQVDMRIKSQKIFEAGVERVDPYLMVQKALSIQNERLFLNIDQISQSWNLADFDRILVLGFGKASARMALGLEAVLGDRIKQGLILVKYGHAEKLEFSQVVEAGHPVPDQAGVDATRRLVALAKEADEKTLVFMLVSGGGSALLCSPLEENGFSINLQDKAALTKILLACGANIHEINAVRRHVSAVKGGRLAAALAPATVVSLILSDVIGDDLNAIASGPTVSDTYSWQDVKAIIDRYGVASKLPESVPKMLEAGIQGKISDTVKPDNPAFTTISNIILGSNRQAALAAVGKARTLGFNTLYLGSRIACEAREAARFYMGIAAAALDADFQVSLPLCIVAGGETTVTLRGKGKGGRNQEMALAALCSLIDMPEALSKRICFLSAGTDGNDGPTDAAGAFADLDFLSLAKKLNLDPYAYLADNDSYSFFSQIDGLLVTGPTNTNVCDLQIVLVG